VLFCSLSPGLKEARVSEGCPSGWKCKGIGNFGKCKIIVKSLKIAPDGDMQKYAIFVGCNRGRTTAARTKTQPRWSR
jgi:hypothetical protein